MFLPSTHLLITHKTKIFLRTAFIWLIVLQEQSCANPVRTHYFGKREVYTSFFFFNKH